MTEYINKADVLDVIGDFQYERFKCGKTHISLSELGDIITGAYILPTIDIVHCKDCKWHEKDGYCPRLWARSTDDFFCGYGERRNNG